MDGNNLTSDQVVGELVGMGFDLSDVMESVKAVGPSINDAIEYITNGSCRNTRDQASSSTRSSRGNLEATDKRSLSSLHSFGRMRQSSITEHLQSAGRPKKIRTDVESDVHVYGPKVFPRPAERPNERFPIMNPKLKSTPETPPIPFTCKEEEGIGPDWEQRVNNLLRKHFGYSSLKNFQKEALEAWLANRDCLVLAATGSGKSLCFQIPALLTGKVVVVISPLISLMHDQCLKLAKCGVSACFLGSGQTDRTIEEKAMRGMYGIIYVCPETILRLIRPLRSLAESRGVALFAVDEVHCISKWGHNFRPDYRRLSVLRENFRADIPLMALTATATICVREDIVKSLCMSEETKIVLTSFFRPNLRFSVKHGSTSPSSYEKNFRELIDIYARKSNDVKKRHQMISNDLEDASANTSSISDGSISEKDRLHNCDFDNIEDDVFPGLNDEISSTKEIDSNTPRARMLSVEYLEDEYDLFSTVDDIDVTCGEFYGQSPKKEHDFCHSFKKHEVQNNPGEKSKHQKKPVEQGPTIIYVPTRKETLSIAKFLSRFGVKAAAYNAKLPKSHLRQVHKEFHDNALEVVVATIAFGMGIDKLNVRRIIHYGWPQSLEAYYQEAGRAGRDGKLADCVLYANLSRIPTLLPSQRNEEQTKQAYKMLSDCFRYGMHSHSCRAKTLVEYFGEDFSHESCLLCDVCINGPPEKQNLRTEVYAFMQIVAAYYEQFSFLDGSYDDGIYDYNKQSRCVEKPSIRTFVGRIREQFPDYSASDLLWWRGLARILEDKGFIRERVYMARVQIKFPEPTDLGLKFLQSKSEEPLLVYPEADMILSASNQKSNCTFSEWGKGWADPEIRRQRLERRRSWRKPRKRKSSKFQPSLKTVRGRLAAKLSKQKYHE